MRAQINIVGFLLVVTITLTISALVFLWAIPFVQQHHNYIIAENVKEQLIELDRAIIEVARERSATSYELYLPAGQIKFTNRSIIYSANLNMPEKYQKNIRYIVGNGSDVVPLGEHPSWIRQFGSVNYEVRYILVNESNTCYGILLLPKGAAGKGVHKIKLKWVSEITSNATCDIEKWQIIRVQVK